LLAEALECYTCTATEAGTDCELHPEKVTGGEYNCNKKYCTLRRVEYKNTGKVYSFYRSCEDNPVYVNNIVEDDTYRTYFYACSSALCNGGTGKSSSNTNSNGAPAGVTKPPFNENVLHMNAGMHTSCQNTVIILMVAITLGRWAFSI